jgi:hypothetical protein
VTQGMRFLLVLRLRGGGGKRSRNPRVRNASIMETLRSTNPSRLRIRQQQRFNIGDSGPFISLLFQLNHILNRFLSACSSKSTSHFTDERASRTYHHLFHQGSAAPINEPASTPSLSQLLSYATSSILRHHYRGSRVIVLVFYCSTD